MRNIIITIIALMSISPVLAQVITTQRPYYYPNQNYNYYRHAHPNQYAHRYNQNRISSNDLTALEKYALKKNYTRDSEIRRLERLEELAFGSIQNGDIRTRFQNVENAILTRPQNNTKTTLLNNLANYFSGQTTGITPQIDPYFDMQYPNYNNSRIDTYSNSLFNNAFRIMNNSYGSGSGVHILD